MPVAKFCISQDRLCWQPGANPANLKMTTGRSPDHLNCRARMWQKKYTGVLFPSQSESDTTNTSRRIIALLSCVVFMHLCFDQQWHVTKSCDQIMWYVELVIFSAKSKFNIRCSFTSTSSPSPLIFTTTAPITVYRCNDWSHHCYSHHHCNQ